jgi:hypothetical protein
MINTQLSMRPAIALFFAESLGHSQCISACIDCTIVADVAESASERCGADDGIYARALMVICIREG